MRLNQGIFSSTLSAKNSRNLPENTGISKSFANEFSDLKDSLAEGGVESEPLSEPKFPLTGKLEGKSRGLGRLAHILFPNTNNSEAPVPRMEKRERRIWKI